MIVVVDDQVLLDVLAGTTSPAAELILGDHDIATTLSWYYRLARAVSSAATRGTLSRRSAALNEAQRNSLQTALAHLPGTITLVESRTLVPVMVAVADTTRANLLTADAIATALILEASVAVSVSSPLLLEAAAIAHVELHVVLNT